MPNSDLYLPTAFLHFYELAEEDDKISLMDHRQHFKMEWKINALAVVRVVLFHETFVLSMHVPVCVREGTPPKTGIILWRVGPL